MKSLLFTICGRAGSKGLKSKNCLDLSALPLVLYSISVIDLFKKCSEYQVTIALNTDSEELRSIVENHYDVSIVPRKADIADDSSSKYEVIKDCYAYLVSQNQSFDFVIDLDITSPLRKLDDLINIVGTIADNDYDCVCSVVESRRNPYFNMVEKVGNSIRLVKPASYTARQQTPRVYDLNASMYAFTPKYLQEHGSIFEGNLGIVEMQDYCVLDIDSPQDYEWMEVIHKVLIEKDNGIKSVYSNISNLAKKGN
ncbi:acylneuraminate cytidylyltransferase family protein [Psychrobacter sp. MES7-P7E]|uniref:acylneuraminate cytidylyltransferase family protein n=1 Tax=Psychrobacter sp. MES7-P7E TaxID=2058322 RepID=UPI000C7F2CAD|nr:acylneuraminate cytidylyltransferase family protein [Psychrobacter sp. MES7-P7E]PLT23137.1 acylneuraminate cytidylyltransferase [Psychrobacter sp. MES7-P7E]